MIRSIFGRPSRNVEGQRRIEKAIEYLVEAKEKRAIHQDLNQEFENVQRWQLQRLCIQYEDLLRNHKTATAAQFLLNEVYFGDPLAGIAHEILKTARNAWRLAPAEMLDAAAIVLETHLLTISIDTSLAQKFLAEGGLFRTGGSKLYCEGLRQENLREQRFKQIQNMTVLADCIERYAGRKSVHLGLKLTESLARKAGVFNLHQFLSRACKILGNTQDLSPMIDLIIETENELLQRVVYGENPFQFMDAPYEARGARSVLSRIL